MTSDVLLFFHLVCKICTCVIRSTVTNNKL